MNCFLIIMRHMLSGLFDIQGGHYIQRVGVEEELRKILTMEIFNFVNKLYKVKYYLHYY